MPRLALRSLRVQEPTVQVIWLADLLLMSASMFCDQGDETQLRRVLTNLIENAIRHTEPDSEIVVSVDRKDSMIEWMVRDTGCGIAEEHLLHVFDHFYRADKTRSCNSGGSGLGLAICQQIVTNHAGTIAVKSTLESGTSFVILLPTG